jgi:hypothetical protein
MLDPPSSTVRQPSVVNIGTFNAIVNAISDTDLYEAQDEPPPSFAVIRNAANILESIPIEGAEVAPYFGEINVTWRIGRNRVKATFGPEPNVFYVYQEQMEQGRVVHNHLEEHPDIDFLRTALRGLQSSP